VTETFDAAWLRLREDIDHRSRSEDLLGPLREWWAERGASKVLDLGCGTGSNLRYLSPRLRGPQAWTLVDHDAALLSHLEAPGGDVRITPVLGDLAESGLREVAQAHLVTASALLDLVSEGWLTALVDACLEAGCGALFALTYDGTMEWSVTDEVDVAVRDAVNDHQRRDKGLGPALGPDAASTAEALFRQRGYRTWLVTSAWRLRPEEVSLGQTLVDGWAGAAAEECPADAEALRTWATRRRADLVRGDVRLTVGHQDLLALPAVSMPTPLER
jgi:hypothetical protein